MAGGGDAGLGLRHLRPGERPSPVDMAGCRGRGDVGGGPAGVCGGLAGGPWSAAPSCAVSQGRVPPSALSRLPSPARPPSPVWHAPSLAFFLCPLGAGRPLSTLRPSVRVLGVCPRPRRGAARTRGAPRARAAPWVRTSCWVSRPSRAWAPGPGCDSPRVSWPHGTVQGTHWADSGGPRMPPPSPMSAPGCHLT